MVSLSTREQEHGGTNSNTVVAYRNDLTQACTFFTHLRVEHWPQVTPEHIRLYILEMCEAQAYRPTTIARKLASLKTFFRYLKSAGYITDDPSEGMSAPHIQKNPPQFLSEEQVAALFRQVAVDTPMGMRDFAMLHLLYATGMRVSELVSLNLADLDMAQATVICSGRNGKRRRERVLPLSQQAREALRPYLAETRRHLILHHPDEQALFVNHHGERLTRQGCWLIIKEYAREAGILQITPHALRHSFAISMLRKGMELNSVKELLGHAHLATTQVYSQLVREEVNSRM